jgi:phage terminase large subunit-like protein
MIELSPLLLEQVQVFSDRIYLPNTDSTITPLPGLEGALQGYSPTLAIVDELAFVREELWSAMTLASGKREHSLVLGISTPGTSRDGVLWQLVEYGREHPADGSFYLKEFAAPLDADVHDEGAWAVANPALGDFLSVDALRLDARTAREDNFRRYRMGLWTSGASAWLSAQAWADCADTSRVVTPREPVVLAFDGSISDDCTALTGCTIPPTDADKPHLFVIEIWAKDEPGWTVDRDKVDAAVHAAFKRYDVREMVCDPYGWREAINRWAKRYGSERVLEYPSYIVSRMAPATDGLATAVRQGQVTHDGNPVLAQHVANARAKNTQVGDVIVKDRKSSPRKIDSAVTSIMAFGRAHWHLQHPRKSRRLVAIR